MNQIGLALGCVALMAISAALTLWLADKLGC